MMYMVNMMKMKMKMMMKMKNKMTTATRMMMMMMVMMMMMKETCCLPKREENEHSRTLGSGFLVSKSSIIKDQNPKSIQWS